MLNGKPQILLLEDDRSLAKKLKELIPKMYQQANRIEVEVWLASDPSDAEQILQEQQGVIDLLITDIVMPDGQPGGLVTAAQTAPYIPVIVISGHDIQQFAKSARKMIAASFVPKGPDFTTLLVREIRLALIWKQQSEPITTEEEELRHVCLARYLGAVLAIRFHLTTISPGQVCDSRATSWDFAALAIGCSDIQKAIEAHGGRVYSFHDQSLLAVFRANECGDGTPFRAAVLSTLEARKRVGDATEQVFYRCPFSAAVTTGMCLSGMFGSRIPGVAAMVGRLGDAAWQLSMRGEPGSLAVVREWLDTADRNWFDGLGTVQSETETWLAGVDSEVEVNSLMLENV